MIEVQLIRRNADDALTSVSPPDCQLHGRWNNSTPTWVGSRRKIEIFLSFDSDELELEHLPVAIVFPS